MIKSLRRRKPVAARKLYVIAIVFAFLLAGIGVGAHQVSVANAATCSRAWGTTITWGPDSKGNVLKSREGYFTDCAVPTSSPANAFVITTGVMTSTTGIGTTAAAQSAAKGTFITQIENYFKAAKLPSPNSTQVHNAFGAAFVIQTMRGLYPHASTANPTDADLADFESRINNPNIVMAIQGDTNPANCPTAANNLAQFRVLTSGSSYAPLVNGHNVGGDISYDSQSAVTTGNPVNCRSIVFKSTSGKVYYQLRELCANSYGNLTTDGLPLPPYSLAPSIIASPSAAEPGSDVQVSPTVNNTGGGSSSGTTWQISTFNLPTGAPVPAAYSGPLSLNPCAYIASQAGTGCQIEGGGTAPDGSTGVGSFATGSPAAFASSSGSTYGVKTRTVSNALGSRVCYMLSVVAVSNVSGNWAHSAASCVLVALKPKIQIIGDDLRVGTAFAGGSPATSNILTSITIRTGKSYGSWDEYGIAASGTVTNAASGSALAGGLACVGINCATNNLTFTNESTPIGNYVSSTTIPDVAASFTATNAPPYVSLADTANRQVETSTTDITIGGGTILKGQWLVINAPKATVTITGDINYDPSPLSSISDIPQLVIIANQINIEGSVQNVDAWLIASGSDGIINTCSDVAISAPLTAAICNNHLQVNGPVMAKKLYLRRTYPSSTTTPGEPAETFNLRPDAYLWATFQASKSARLETTYAQELPPRF